MYRKEIKSWWRQVGLVVLWFVAALVLTTACTKDETDIKPEPHIDLLEVNPTNIVEYQDSLLFRISYRDGDGDLGENRAGVNNLFLVDKRVNATYAYRIPEIVPDGNSAPIKGSFTFSLRSVARTDSLPEQTCIYEIYVIDRAGRQSNTVATPPITLRRG